MRVLAAILFVYVSSTYTLASSRELPYGEVMQVFGEDSDEPNSDEDSGEHYEVQDSRQQYGGQAVGEENYGGQDYEGENDRDQVIEEENNGSQVLRVKNDEIRNFGAIHFWDKVIKHEKENGSSKVSNSVRPSGPLKSNYISVRGSRREGKKKVVNPQRRTTPEIPNRKSPIEITRKFLREMLANRLAEKKIASEVAKEIIARRVKLLKAEKNVIPKAKDTQRRNKKKGNKLRGLKAGSRGGFEKKTTLRRTKENPYARDYGLPSRAEAEIPTWLDEETAANMHIGLEPILYYKPNLYPPRYERRQDGFNNQIYPIDWMEQIRRREEYLSAPDYGRRYGGYQT